ncbi:MAG: hypothetical protein KF809_12685 [Chloroflexi bacterium]|nr:hypothetical protein [Chloroflexota bacterium]
MPRRRSMRVLAVLASLILVALPGLPTTAASPVRFGAKLDRFTEPTPAERCAQHGSIPAGSTCTWVAAVAFQNAGKHKAPKNGTIGKIRLISCVAGSFTVQAARKQSGSQKFKVVRSGPTINYKKDTRSQCGGDGFDDFKIQSFNVNFTVKKGDYIAVKAKKVGFMRNSSSGDTLLFEPPLKVGGGFKSKDTTTGSMLIQFQYK